MPPFNSENLLRLPPRPSPIPPFVPRRHSSSNLTPSSAVSNESIDSDRRRSETDALPPNKKQRVTIPSLRSEEYRDLLTRPWPQRWEPAQAPKLKEACPECFVGAT